MKALKGVFNLLQIERGDVSHSKRGPLAAAVDRSPFGVFPSRLTEWSDPPLRHPEPSDKRATYLMNRIDNTIHTYITSI